MFVQHVKPQAAVKLWFPLKIRIFAETCITNRACIAQIGTLCHVECDGFSIMPEQHPWQHGM